MRTLLHGVEPNDPLTLAAGTFVFLGVALVATTLPARKAATMDPVEALCTERP